MSAYDGEMRDNDPVSWRGLVYNTPVVTADGNKVGTVHEVLGSDAEDIFHGIRLANGRHHDVMLAASDITSMSHSAIVTSLSADDVAALPLYDETATYHLASVGWLRKHLGWKQDSHSDEEPGG
jgi:uncharacterized protein YrrD